MSKTIEKFAEKFFRQKKSSYSIGNYSYYENKIFHYSTVIVEVLHDKKLILLNQTNYSSFTSKFQRQLFPLVTSEYRNYTQIDLGSFVRDISSLIGIDFKKLIQKFWDNNYLYILKNYYKSTSETSQYVYRLEQYISQANAISEYTNNHLWFEDYIELQYKIQCISIPLKTYLNNWHTFKSNNLDLTLVYEFNFRYVPYLKIFQSVDPDIFLTLEEADKIYNYFSGIIEIPDYYKIRMNSITIQIRNFIVHVSKYNIIIQKSYASYKFEKINIMNFTRLIKKHDNYYSKSTRIKTDNSTPISEERDSS